MANDPFAAFGGHAVDPTRVSAPDTTKIPPTLFAKNNSEDTVLRLTCSSNSNIIDPRSRPVCGLRGSLCF